MYDDNTTACAHLFYALVHKIAEVDYDRLPSSSVGGYSSLVGEVVERCLTYDKTTRPDSVQVSSSTARS